MKKIKQAEENEKKQAERNSLGQLQVSFFQQPSKFLLITPVILQDQRILFPLYIYQYSSRYLEAIFRPPKQIV